MNQLSWLLYIADVVGGLNVILSIASLALLIITGICFVLSCTYDGGRTFEDDKAVREDMKGKGKRVLLLLVVVALLDCVVPGRNTVYAIAASQIGEQVLKTPVAGKAEQALESWLDKQIRDNGDTPATDKKDN